MGEEIVQDAGDLCQLLAEASMPLNVRLETLDHRRSFAKREKRLTSNKSSIVRRVKGSSICNN